MPEGVTSLCVHLLHLLEKGFCCCTVGILFKGALLQLFLIALLLGVGLDVGFLTEAKRSDNGQRHLPHAELDGHRGEVSLESEIHQGGMDDVILMMAKSNLRAA